MHDDRPPAPLPDLPAVVRRSGRIGVYERDLRTGTGRWDEGMFELCGLDPVAGTPGFEQVLAVVHEDDRERLAAFHAEMGAGARAHGELRYRLRRPDGSVRHVHSFVDLLRDASGAPALARGVVIDETDARTEALAARERSAQLERSIELADISVWRIDLTTQRIHFNPTGFRLSAVPPVPEGLPLQAVRDTIHPDDVGAVVAAAEQAMRTRAAVDVIARFVNPDGSRRTLLTRRVAVRDAHDRPTELHGISIDLTELMAEREKAQRLGELVRHITDAAGVGLWSRDIDTGETEWNAPMLALYGLPPDAPSPAWDEFLERYVHPDDRARFLADVKQADRDGRPVKHIDFRVRTADGRERWIYSWARREVRDGRLVAFGINVDVTDRHQAEAERRERERLEQAARAQSALLARVSHELRTPMNAVLGFAELLQADREHPLDARQAERVARIRDAGRHLLSLIDDLLELAAIDAADRQPQWQALPLDDVLARVLPWVAPMADQHGVRIERDEPLAGTVRADARWLVQVASNLLTNAIKYNRRGGWVRLATRRRERGGVAQWALVVADSGRGLSAEQQRRLFEPFERLGAEHEGIAGSGIGLTIVRRAVEAMDGEIEVDSAPDAGAEFRVWLPAVDAALAAGDTSPATPPPAPGRLRVLCIEDNEVNRTLIEGLFRLRPDVELRIAVDGRSGIAAALAGPPDVVLLDMQLPDMHGAEVLARLRAEPRLAGCTVIGLSANAMPDDVRAALDAGFDDYWTKPIDLRRFLAGIDALIERRAAAAAP